MKLNLIAPINTLSYGYVSCYIIRELHKKGFDISLHPIGPIQPEDKFISDIQRALALQKWFDYDGPCIRIFHQNSMEQWVGDGERIAFPIFELNKFSDLEKHHLDFYNVDQILVCSKWAKKIVDDQIKYAKCDVVPLGVDTEVFVPHINKRKTTVFFNCGKWEKRKGHDIIPEIFNKAFSKDDDVELWMMPGNGYLENGENEIWENHYKLTPLGNKIKFVPPVRDQNQAAYIMQQTDCGIFPSRAEGWGLPILEMMSCGKFIITTNYSGQTEFCNEKNSMLVNISATELARDNKWFKDGVGEWASLTESELNQIIEYMRTIHKQKRSGLLQNNEGIITANKFTWLNTVHKLIEALEI